VGCAVRAAVTTRATPDGVNPVVGVAFLAGVLVVYGSRLSYGATLLILWPIAAILRHARAFSWWALTLTGSVGGVLLFPLYAHALERRGTTDFFPGVGAAAVAATGWVFWYIASRRVSGGRNRLRPRTADTITNAASIPGQTPSAMRPSRSELSAHETGFARPVEPEVIDALHMHVRQRPGVAVEFSILVFQNPSAPIPLSRTLRGMINPRQLWWRTRVVLTFAGIGTASTHTDFRRDAEPEEVAPGVFVFPSFNATESLVDGNATIIIGSRAVLLVDAPSQRLTREHVAWLRRRTKLPVKYLVQTHWHADHTRGTATVTDAFPGVSILASEYTRRIGGRRLPAIYRQYAGDFVDSGIARVKRRVASGQDAHGNRASQFDLDRANRMVAYLTRELPDYKTQRYVAPTETVESERKIELGGRAVIVRHYPGHTPGDLVVIVPDGGVVITGDLVVHPVPYGTENTVFRQWSRSLTALERLPGIKIIVPGHGAVLHSWEYVRLEREAIDSMMAQANAAVTDGLTYEQAFARLDLSRFRTSFAGSDRDRQWAFDNYFLGYRRAYDEASGLVD
jgi:glyoxylase-like metal-dependent hydrolase (beta-lactamase superfamily II)